MRSRQLVATLACLSPVVIHAQQNQTPLTPEEQAVEKNARREFAGLSLGVGLALTLDVGSTQRVKSASIVDNVVRVDADDDKEAGIMLESHYFFLPNKSFLGVAADNWGWGPFVALKPGTGEIIEALGLGAMIGFRRPQSDDSWNIGVGYVVDPNVQVLGDGFVANEPPPGTETTVRYKETSQEGWLITFSFSF